MAIIVGNSSNRVESNLDFPEILKRLSTTLDLSMVKDSPTVSRYAVSSVDGGNQPNQLGGGGPPPGTGTVTSFSFTNANGFTGVVTSPFTTPNLTLDGNNKLSLMGDVNITSVSGGQLLEYDSGSSKWVNFTPDYMSNPMTTAGDIIVALTGGTPARLGAGSNGDVLTISAGIPAWESGGGGSGTVTTVSVATANGFAGTVANPTTTPAITIETTVTGLLLGNGTSVASGPMTTKGDIIIENATPYPDRLAIGSTGQILSVVSGLPAWVANPGVGNVQIFGAGSNTWTMPPNVSMVYILCLGAGGNGGTGYSGASYSIHCGGGGGGGSGGQMMMMVPASFLPTTLYVQVAAAGSAGKTYVGLQASYVVSDVFCLANGGTNGGSPGGAGSAGGGGSGGGLPVTANTVLCGLFYGNGALNASAGQAGSAGAISNPGTIVNAPTGGLILMGGAGGAGPSYTTSSAGYIGGYQQGTAGTVLTLLSGGTAGTNAGTAGGNGQNGSNYRYSGFFYPSGGTGGGAPGVSATGVTSSGGAGGSAGVGCGGGGGAGSGASAGGAGGAGGDGMVIIVSW